MLEGEERQCRGSLYFGLPLEVSSGAWGEEECPGEVAFEL